MIEADDIEKLTDDVVVMQEADGYAPSVWCSHNNDYVLLGVYGYRVLPRDCGCETRIVLLTTDAVRGDMQLGEVNRFFKLVSHRSVFADDDRAWDFRCMCGHERTLILDTLTGIVLDGKMTCSWCGYNLIPLLKVFHDAVIRKKEIDEAKARI